MAVDLFLAKLGDLLELLLLLIEQSINVRGTN